MNRKNINILNSFIKTPLLEISSADFSFSHFDFYGETILTSDFVWPKHSIIGIQAEKCFEAYLTASQHYQLVASNLQIYSQPNDSKDERSTLGELDYIIKNLKTGEIVHVELAYKFYLFDPGILAQEEGQWIGPNRKDSLLEKLIKTRDKQFPLINSKEALAKLRFLKIGLPTKQQLCLKCHLFIPKSMNLEEFPMNYQKCIVGKWMRFEEFVNEDRRAQFYIPNKKEWLLPLEGLEDWTSFAEATQQISEALKKFKSPLVYTRMNGKITRIFVVWW